MAYAGSGPGGVLLGGSPDEQVAGSNQEEHDKYVDRLLKYVPAEVVPLYIFLDGLIQGAPDTVNRAVVLWIVFALLLGGTWAYLQRVRNVSKPTQLVISTAAFAVWVFYLGGPFAQLACYDRFYGTLILPLYTFAIGLVEATGPEANNV
jgi:hypothetical protein